MHHLYAENNRATIAQRMLQVRRSFIKIALVVDSR